MEDKDLLEILLDDFPDYDVLIGWKKQIDQVFSDENNVDDDYIMKNFIDKDKG